MTWSLEQQVAGIKPEQRKVRLVELPAKAAAHATKPASVKSKD